MTNRTWKLLAIAAFMSAVIFNVAYADDDHTCQGGHNCNDSADSIDMSSAINNSISDTSSRYGVGLGDVDIAQCYRSYQILIWQDSKINPICLADSYDAKGLYKMAAIIRCDIRAIRKHFGSELECLTANTVMIHVEPMAEPVNDAEDDERYEALYSRMSEYEARTVKAEAEAKTASRQAQRVPQPIIQQQEFISESKRAKLESLRGEK